MKTLKGEGRYLFPFFYSQEILFWIKLSIVAPVCNSHNFFIIHIFSILFTQQKLIKNKGFINSNFMLDLHYILWFNCLSHLNRVYITIEQVFALFAVQSILQAYLFQYIYYKTQNESLPRRGHGRTIIRQT